MKGKILYLVICFFPNFLVAQFTITSADFPAVGDRLAYQVNNSVSNLAVGDTGRVQVWDFRNFTRQSSQQIAVIDPAGAPNIDSFPNANLVFSANQGATFSFFQLTDTAFWSHGSFIGSFSEVNSLLLINDPPKLEIALPAIYGTRYQSKSVNERNLGDIGGGMSLILVNAETVMSEADASGIMRLEQGDFEVLRVKTILNKVDSTFFETNGVRSFLSAINSVETNYDWYAKESRGPLVSFQSSGGTSSFIVSILDIEASVFGDSVNIPKDPPIALFDTIRIGKGDYLFFDRSDGFPDQWRWDFDNGLISNVQSPRFRFTTPGDYNVCLIASNLIGSDTTCKVITIPFVIPNASFSFAQGENGLISTQNLTAGPGNQYFWDFGDGNTSTEISPTHQYQTEGSYQLCLIASNNAGSDTLCQTIMITNILPDAAFSLTETSVGQFQFTNSSTGIIDEQSWDFGDGNTSMEENPLYQFTAEGTFNVCLVVSNDAGADTLCQMIVVEDLFPDAAFSSTQEGIAKYSFEDLSENTPNAWSWNFGDGNTSMEQNPTHQFLQEGIFEVCLKVSNDFGQDSTCQQYTIANLFPSALFSQDSIGQGSFQFFNESSANATNYSWDFGDNTKSTEQNPMHQFFAEGDFNVCLVAQNDFGTDTICQVLQVRNLVPVASFMINQLAGEADSLYFFDTSTNLPTNWRWDFGDGTSSVEQNPAHRYTASGMYQVCMVATNTFGVDSVCQEVNVIISDVLQRMVASGLQVSPNPFQSDFQIAWQGMVPKVILTYEIYNTQGQQMGVKKYLQAQQMEYTENWPMGTYWLQIKTLDGRLIKSFPLVKQ